MVCVCPSGKGIVSRHLLPGPKWKNECGLLGVLFHNTERRQLPLLQDICLPFKILHNKAVLEHQSTALGCTGRRYLHLLPCIATRLWWRHPKNQCRTRGGSLHTCAQSNTITLDMYSLVNLIVSPQGHAITFEFVSACLSPPSFPLQLRNISKHCTILYSPAHKMYAKKVDYFFNFFLTPSLPKPVRFPGWKMHRRACKQYIFRPFNNLLSMCTFWWKSFHNTVRKRKQKALRVSNLTFLLAIFKWHHGSEGVKKEKKRKEYVIADWNSNINYPQKKQLKAWSLKVMFELQTSLPVLMGRPLESEMSWINAQRVHTAFTLWPWNVGHSDPNKQKWGKTCEGLNYAKLSIKQWLI